MSSPRRNPAAERALAAYQQALKQKLHPTDAGPEPEKLPGDSLLKAKAFQRAKGQEAPKATQGGTTQVPLPRPAEGLVRKASSESRESKYRKIAQFLVLIGSTEAAGILAKLDRDQVEAISKEIANLPGISPRESEMVLAEFQHLLSRPYRYRGSVSGGIDEARRLLYGAFGPEKGEAILTRAVPEAVEQVFDFLKDFSEDQIIFLFRDETPAAEAMVLSRLPPPLIARVLKKTEKYRKLAIAKRIARMDKVSPEVLRQVASALREKARYLGQADSAPLDGLGVLTEILKSSDVSFGDRILEELEEKDPTLGRTLKERLYTLDDLIGANDRPVEEKLKTMTNREIALLLKGKSEGFTQKILANLSTGRESIVREEGEILGPVPRIEVEAVAREFLAWFRQNHENGRIILEDEEFV